MIKPSKRNDISELARTRWLRLGILIISFLVYLWGIQRDLSLMPDVDEPIFVERAVTMAASGHLNPGFFGNPGSTIFYPLAAIYHIWYAVTQNGTLFQADPNLQLRLDENFWEFYFLGRFLSVAYGMMSVSLIYLLGRRIFKERVAFVAVWLFIFYPLPEFYPKMVRTDSAAVFWGLLSLWFCLKVYDQPTRQNQLLAGFSIGLSIASRYFMIALVPILLLMDGVILWQRTLEASRRRTSIAAMIGLLSVCVGFIVSTPYFFLDFNTVFEDLFYEARNTQVGADGLSPVGNLLWYLTDAIPNIITWPQVVLAILGIVLILARGKFLQLVNLVFILIFLMGISLSSLHWSRWIIQILPIFALLIAYASDVIVVWFSKRLRLSLQTQHRLIVLIILLVSAWPTYRVILLNLQQASPSTHILAHDWILQNLPVDARIALEARTVRFDETEYVIFHAWSLGGTKVTPNEAYKRGYRYVIVSSSIYDPYFAEPDRYASEIYIYESLFNNNKLLKKFEPSKTRGGPTIQIYELLKP